MNLALRKALAAAIKGDPAHRQVITALTVKADGTGTITYNPAGAWVDPDAPGFSGTTTEVGDEELVRAYLLLRLVSGLAYPTGPEFLEIERTYKPVGRPTGKGGRVDLLVRKKRTNGQTKGDAFLFIECKAPDKFDNDLKMIEGQLFLLSRQEEPRPRYLVYYTVELRSTGLLDRLILIDTSAFPAFEDWDRAGQPITDALPRRYGLASKRRFANVPAGSPVLRPLDTSATPDTFNRIRSEIHDVIWGGGGTNNNEVFVYITKLILCKIYDEKETAPGAEYRFQRLGDAIAPETAAALAGRMNNLYREAEHNYLALPQPSEGPAFDPTRISPEKIAYVVGRLESVSVTENAHPGDLLGEFFEQIVSQDFTQTKGQFFTPLKLVRFMLHLVGADQLAHDVMLHKKDHLGRPRLPFVIDPACGSGTFLIEYMRLVQRSLVDPSIATTLPRRIHDSHDGWFKSAGGNAWAREFLFGVENNYDLGLAAKVNMVLHGDGSMNTWICSGLLPFTSYWVEGRHNVLGTHLPATPPHPYTKDRNEQFDLVVSNPPFSIKMSPDEKDKVDGAFQVTSAARSEAIFVERWYQLLREDGVFSCVLPEAILDTATNEPVRLFLLQHFAVLAVVSLPYDAFRPFTSTKTCVLLARKRSAKDATAWRRTWEQARRGNKEATTRELCQVTLDALGWGDEDIFMAEPASIGYKRRKNLPDLTMPNQLYRETATGDVDNSPVETTGTVLDAYRAGPGVSESDKRGFWISLANVTTRDGLRLDPKYRWLWDKMGGLAHGHAGRARPLHELLDLVDLPKVPKGELSAETRLIDLEFVESRQGIVREDCPVVDTIGSDKVRFDGCDFVFSKLEPYLAKLIICPDAADIGSTEWVGLKRKTNVPLHVLAYTLMLPDVCEAYRRLQAGKRHARLDPREMLDLRVEVAGQYDWLGLDDEINRSRDAIQASRVAEKRIRYEIDKLVSGIETDEE